MRTKLFVLLIIAYAGITSCNNSGNNSGSGNELAQTAILQQQDGTISLEVNKATTYHDINNPQTNTAEWNVIVSKKGRYDVWLSAATNDPEGLKYDNSVRVSIKDNQLEARPDADKVIPTPNDGSYPFKADSFIGSMFLADTGLYSIQVISDKILPDDTSKKPEEVGKLISVSFTPVTD